MLCVYVFFRFFVLGAVPVMFRDMRPKSIIINHIRVTSFALCSALLCTSNTHTPAGVCKRLNLHVYIIYIFIYLYGVQKGDGVTEDKCDEDPRNHTLILAGSLADWFRSHIPHVWEFL